MQLGKGENAPSSGLLMPFAVSLWYKKPSLSNISDLISDLEWTSLMLLCLLNTTKNCGVYFLPFEV